MKTVTGHPRRLIVLGLLTGVALCATNPAHALRPGPGLLLTTYSRRASQQGVRLADPNGSIFVVEYHHIRAGKGDMFRPADQFRADLEKFYSLGFRPILASEFLANHWAIPHGTTPVVITFDDSMPTQLQLTATGTVDPKCAVGIWQQFAYQHPDFPVRATFFVLPNTMWGQKKLQRQKVELIHRLGCEMANHTTTHPKLSHLNDDQVKFELGNATDRLLALGQAIPHSLALPYGISPKNRDLLKGFNWQGKRIQFTGVFLVGANPSPSPNSPKFNRYRVPRIMATASPYGLDFWLKQLAQGRVKLYVQP